jgi:hypothetical protein
MPRAKPSPLRLHELLRRLGRYGVEVRRHGKHLVLIRPESPGGSQGPIYPMKDHGPGTEIDVAVIHACLRRFGITPREFWSGTP